MAGVLLLALGLACSGGDPDGARAPGSTDETVPSDTAPDPDPDAEPDPDTDLDPDTAADTASETECERVHGVGEPLALPNACGTLSYGLYAAQGETTPDNVLPDFSHAGYRGGGVALPRLAVVERVSPGEGDDRARIQAALDAVASRMPDDSGHRGAVLLEAGTYEVGDSLRIEASGVVLRGEGQGTDGTVLVATQRAQHSFVVLQGAGSGMGEVAGTRRAVTDLRVPVGAATLTVEDASVFAVGDAIAVERTPNEVWITTLGMDAWGWTASAYAISHERRVVAVDGDTLTLDLPLVDALDASYGGGSVYRTDLSGRIEEVGVEDLRLVSVHSSATDEAHGWIGVELRRVTNGWVRGVTVEHFGYAAVSMAAESSFNTAEEVAMVAPVSQVTGGRRYSFNVSDGTGNLFQRCYSEQARHDFVTGSRTTGPHVWLDCLSVESTNDDGPHHRWSTGLLFDNVLSHELHVENREDSGSGHGWSGGQTLFWNALAEGIRVDAPQGAMNWLVGSMGDQQEGGWAPDEPFGWWESHNRPVEPRSLYLKQLEARLGPGSVDAVTTEAQREGRIWGQLASWAGEGALADAPGAGGDATCSGGLAMGLACCANSCGSCGGEGCGGRPGGAAACCTGAILESGTSCQVDAAPCVLDPAFGPVGG